jgi:hypothetical protein
MAVKGRGPRVNYTCDTNIIIFHWQNELHECTFCTGMEEWCSCMVFQPISGLGLLFMRFRNLTLIEGW